MRKKQLDLERVNSSSLITDLDLYIDRTDLKTLIGQFADSCFVDNEFASFSNFLYHRQTLFILD